MLSASTSKTKVGTIAGFGLKDLLAPIVRSFLRDHDVVYVTLSDARRRNPDELSVALQRLNRV